MERLGHIHLAEDGGTGDLVSEGSEVGEGVDIEDGLAVEQPVVAYRPERAI